MYSHTTVQNWTEFNLHFYVNRIGAMQIMTELRSKSNLHSVQVWSALVQRTLRNFQIMLCSNHATSLHLYQLL